MDQIGLGFADRTRREKLVKRAERVAGRTSSQTNRRFDRGLVGAESGRPLYVIQQRRECLRADESEL